MTCYRPGDQGPEDALSAVLAVALGGVGHGRRNACWLKTTIRGGDSGQAGVDAAQPDEAAGDQKAVMGERLYVCPSSCDSSHTIIVDQVICAWYIPQVTRPGDDQENFYRR